MTTKERPVAILDCDEILLEMRRYLLDLCVPSLRGKAVPTWEYFYLMTPEEEAAARYMMKDPTFWRKIPVKEGAQEGVRKLREQGFDILVATAPYRGCKSWGDARYKILERKFNILPDMVQIGTQKHRIDGAFIMEDKPSTIAAWGKKHPKGLAVVMDMPYNQNANPLPNEFRMFGWADLDRMLDCYAPRLIQR